MADELLNTLIQRQLAHSDPQWQKASSIGASPQDVMRARPTLSMMPASPAELETVAGRLFDFQLPHVTDVKQALVESALGAGAAQLGQNAWNFIRNHFNAKSK